MDLNQYMGMFLEESREHLQTLNNCLLALENDPSSLAVLDEIFRSAHTIKGMSATMGFTTIAELTHEMENVLDLLRKGTLSAKDDITDILFTCVDILEQLVENVASGLDKPIDVQSLIAKLSAIARGEFSAAVSAGAVSVEDSRPVAKSATAALKLSDMEIGVVRTAKAQGMECYEINVELRQGCLLKSARAYMVMNALEELGEVIKSIPPVDDLEQENFDHCFQLFVLTTADAENIESIVSGISEVERVTATVAAIPELSQQPVQNTTALLEPIVTKGEKTPEHKKEKRLANELNSQSIDKKMKSGQSVRVDIDKLDSLLNLVGELVINKTRLEQIGLIHRLSELVETIEQMDRVTTDLQAVVMKVRMVPVSQVFNRFPRMVRDLSRELNKEVNLIIQGEETELDRTVIDEIGDPLVHLLRNSLDHGIEHPAERQAAGKNPVGEVRLTARHEGNNVIIMVEDDGKGINADIIRQKAVEKGIITQAEADKLEPSEAVRLVFLPGFSTADTVTDVSGRGVGMDAVKTKIESLGGMVDVETKISEGSTFKIRLPLTLAIIQALLVKVCDEIYAIPLGNIDSTINIRAEDIKTVQSQEAILLRGQIIPIVRLTSVLNIPNACLHNQDELFVVIVHIGEYRAGIIVDTLIGQQEIVIKSMGKLLAGIKVIAGATILGNGHVALILDVGALKQ